MMAFTGSLVFLFFLLLLLHLHCTTMTAADARSLNDGLFSAKKNFYHYHHHQQQQQQKTNKAKMPISKKKKRFFVGPFSAAKTGLKGIWSLAQIYVGFTVTKAALMDFWTYLGTVASSVRGKTVVRGVSKKGDPLQKLPEVPDLRLAPPENALAAPLLNKKKTNQKWTLSGWLQDNWFLLLAFFIMLNVVLLLYLLLFRRRRRRRRRSSKRSSPGAGRKVQRKRRTAKRRKRERVFKERQMGGGGRRLVEMNE